MFVSLLVASFITTGGGLVGFLALVGFIIASRAYGKAKTVESLNTTNTILVEEVDALKLSRDRMRTDLDTAKQERANLTIELDKVSARTDLVAHQKHLDNQHSEGIALLTKIVEGTNRIADESAARNGHIAEMVASIRRDIPSTIS